MCGIAGVVGSEMGHDARAPMLARMCGAIRHRGPDDEGMLLRPRAALGMRRLSIIDVEGGEQPIANEDRTAWVVFNGEIYNYASLREGLLSRGHRLRSRSDTETLVHLYEEHGPDLVHELRGMFAFALWDETRGSLLLARDRVGIKPLYYWPTPDGLAFASELRSLLAASDATPSIDPAAIGHYLAFGYVPDPLAVFRDVRKLSPGHLLTWSATEGIRTRRYWSPPTEEHRTLREGDAIEELRRLLADSVQAHLQSEVPLGAFLSGGIDSSAVVATMTRTLDRPVHTFSIGFSESGYNEAPHAAEVARELGTVHTDLVVHPDVDALVEEVVHGFDEPFADSSALPTYLVSRLAREHVTVALSGDGGDELFGGYTRYTERLGRWEMRPALLRRALRGAARLLPHASPGRNRLLDLGRSRRGRYATSVATALSVSDGGVALPEIARLVPPLDLLLDEYFEEASGRDFPSQMMHVDLMSYLPGDILTKVDRMSMAVSLEARVPLLDHRLVEFAAALPSSLKIRDGDGKWLLRKAIEPLVPRRVLERPKQGFAAPLDRWLRADLRHRLEWLLRADSPIYEYVARPAVRRLVAEHVFGRRDHSGVLWRLLVLDLWIRSLRDGLLARSPMPGSSLFEIIGRATTQSSGRPAAWSGSAVR